MADSKIRPPPSGSRGEPLRQRVIDAAERLLRQGKADFAMRDLAAEAGVSFATPFNQFGSKAAIMQALSHRRIDTMEARFATAQQLEHHPIVLLSRSNKDARQNKDLEVSSDLLRSEKALGDAADRVVLAIDIATTVMLDEPAVNRAVMGWLGTAGPAPGQVWARSTALWALALREGEGLVAERREQALRCLPGHLAYGFRGVLSFWTAGELPDAQLARSAREVANSLLLGFID
ncbi:MAG: TetR/AcrR family transcriptional regulator [Janthinobacterium lividum]